MCWVVKYNGPHPLLQSTLVFLCVLGLKILLGCGLNMIIQMSVVLKNIVIRDSDLTTRAYSVCFRERIKSHIRPLVVLSKFLTRFNVWQEWTTSIFLNIYTSSRVSFWAFTFTGQRQILPGENNSEYFSGATVHLLRKRPVGLRRKSSLQWVKVKGSFGN